MSSGIFKKQKTKRCFIGYWLKSGQANAAAGVIYASKLDSLRSGGHEAVGIQKVFENTVDTHYDSFTTTKPFSQSSPKILESRNIHNFSLFWADHGSGPRFEISHLVGACAVFLTALVYVITGCSDYLSVLTLMSGDPFFAVYHQPLVALGPLIIGFMLWNSRARIHMDYVLLVGPSSWMGTYIGVYLHGVLPSQPILLFMILLLIQCSVSLAQRGIIVMHQHNDCSIPSEWSANSVSHDDYSIFALLVFIFSYVLFNACWGISTVSGQHHLMLPSFCILMIIVFAWSRSMANSIANGYHHTNQPHYGAIVLGFICGVSSGMVALDGIWRALILLHLGLEPAEMLCTNMFLGGSSCALRALQYVVLGHVEPITAIVLVFISILGGLAGGLCINICIATRSKQSFVILFGFSIFSFFSACVVLSYLLSSENAWQSQ